MFNKPTNTGMLKHPIEILEFISGIDENGLSVENWVIDRKVRCMVTNPKISKGEENTTEGITSKKIKYFTFRKRKDYNSKLRIRYKNQLYDVEGVADFDYDDLYQTVRGILVT